MSYESEAAQDDGLNDCVHYWLIDGKNAGICKKCGASRQFPLSWSPLSMQNAWSHKSTKIQPTAPGTKS